MADTVFTLGIELDSKNAAASLKDLQKELEKTANSAKGLGSGFSAGLAGVSDKIDGITGRLKGLTSGGLSEAITATTELTAGMGMAASAIVGLGAVAITATAALIANASAMAAAADDAAEMADKLGVTTTELAALELAANENGTSITSLVAIYDRLTNSLDEVEKGNLKTINAFRALGLQQSDLAGLSEKEIAGVVIRNYEALGRTVQATAAVQDILGKSFRDQIPAIKAYATESQDYINRVATSGAVASKALEEAGARQEKAFNDLSLAIKGLKNNFADFFTDTATEAATWATELITSFNKVYAVYGKTPLVTLQEKINILNQETGGMGRFGNDADIARADARIQRLNEERQAAREAADATKRLNEYRGTSTAGGGRGIKNPPLVTLTPNKDTPPEKVIQEKLTEEQKAIIAVSQKATDAMFDLDFAIKTAGLSGDSTALAIAKLENDLLKAGKGFLTTSQAAAIAAGLQDKFKQSIEATNLANFNKQVQSLNQDYDLQLKLLTATTDKEREQIKLRSQLSKQFENQSGGMTVEQAKALEEALKNANAQFEKIQQQRIDNSVGNAMKDLTDQTEQLNFELENYWSTNRDGIVNVNNALKSLEKQIDPEGRGKNISDAQREQLKAQLEIIEQKKQELEWNRKLDDSYKSLGDAATNWALGTKDAIKQVRLEFLRLLLTQSAKYFGASSSGPVGSFIGGILGGLGGARAEGGPVEAGKTYIVGEKGAEMVTFNQAGYVLPNQQISTTTARPVQVTMAPNLIIQGSVTGQTELEQMFEQFANAMAQETQNFVISQRGQNGILAR